MDSPVIFVITEFECSNIRYYNLPVSKHIFNSYSFSLFFCCIIFFIRFFVLIQLFFRWNEYLLVYLSLPSPLSVSAAAALGDGWQGVNFTNVLWAAFTPADPKSAKKLLNLTVFFALLGSACVKAARRMLVKLTPDWSDLRRKRFVWNDALFLLLVDRLGYCC